jgi:Zn-dependent protease with chaperone function
MDRADFIHLVRLGEHASAKDSRAYRRSVAAFAALGYAWVIGCLLVAAIALAWTAAALLRRQFEPTFILLLLLAGGLLWTSWRALWCPLRVPPAVRLSTAEAPALFQALERIRRKIKGPPIDRVLLDGNFNASISQYPRYGLFGGAVNHLTIGLPLLLALDRPRLLAVLAHEYGHLRGDDGRFAAWIYRTRLSWAKLDQGLHRDQGRVASAAQAFLRWYFPRFSAKTFALARQDEYAADQIAGKLLGRDVTAAALIEIAVKRMWLSREFWPGHWRGAAGSTAPLGPYGAMRKLLASPPPANFARETLRQSLQETGDVDDTHPGLKNRLDALEAGNEIPDWSIRPALDLLHDGGTEWVIRFDEQWCRDNAMDWKQHHAYLARVRVRVQALAASAARNNADEMTQLGDLKRRLNPAADVRLHYERALEITAGHAGALRGMVQCLPAAEHAVRMACLNQLFEGSPADRWWSSQIAVAELEQRLADGAAAESALTLWRQRLKQAEEDETQAWNALATPPLFQATGPHDLNEFEKGEIQAGLARCRPVVRAWLVRKTLPHGADRRCYLLLLELPGLNDEERYHLCRELELSLDLPGPAVALWAGHSPTLQEIEHNAFDALYARGPA